MKIFALALVALVLTFGMVPVALAQDSQNQTPSAAPSSPPAGSAQESAPKAPDMKAPDTKVDVDIKADAPKTDDSVAASPRTGEGQRTGFFGLSPTAAIIVSAAILLVVVLAIVAMTNSGRGTTYIDTDRRV